MTLPARYMTPQLARERARMGALRARTRPRTIGGADCMCQRPVRTLGDLSASLPPVNASQVRAALPANLQASWDAHVADYNASSAEQAGASAALALASGHFDNASAVHAFAGAVQAFPGVGPVMGQMAEFFLANGAAIGDAFGNLFGLNHCNKDDRTPAAWISAAKIRPATGSFAAVVVPMLALAYSDFAACREGAHGIGWKPCSQIIPAAVGAWNAIATGGTIDYFVPQLASTDCSFALSQFFGGIRTDSGMLTRGDQGPYAFVPLSKVPSSMLTGEGLTWARVKAKAGPVVQPAPAPVRHVTLNLHLPQPAPKAAAAAKASAPMSTGGKVAVGAAAAGGAGLVAWLAVNGWKWVTPRWARVLVR